MLGVIYAGLASFGFGILFNIRGKKLITAALGGSCGWLVYLLAAPFGELLQYFSAAASIAIYGEIMARVEKAPVTIYLAPALIPLVPGGSIYKAMLHALNQENELFITVGLYALTVTAAIAIGIVVASSTIRIFFTKKSRT